jgi:hypothetical protein
MLASTVQFSNNNQPHVTHHQQTVLHRNRHRKHHRTAAASSDTQQRAQHSPTSPSPLHTPHKREAVLGNKPTERCRIVNVPPMSNHRRTYADVMALDNPFRRTSRLDAP